MLEIEVKATVKDRVLLEQRLMERGIVLSAPQTQIDHVFVKSVESVQAFYTNTIFVRIREQGDKKPTLTLKQKRQELASLEYETEIESVEVMSQILEQLSLVHALTIEKSRTKGAYQEYTICLDEVFGLGTFVEVEKLVLEGNADVIQDELFLFLQSLGVSKKDRVSDAYDTLLLKKKFKTTAV
jgi:adenylate cyclase class 2